MANQNKQQSGPVYTWRGQVADDTAMNAIATPVANNFCVKLDDALNNIVYVYNGTEWNKIDNNGGLIGNFSKQKVIIQEASVEFLVSTGVTKQWRITATQDQVMDDRNNAFAAYISAIPKGVTTDTGDTIRIVAW